MPFTGFILGKVGTVVGSSSLRGRKLAGWLVGWLVGWLAGECTIRGIPFLGVKRERERGRKRESLFLATRLYRLTCLCISTLYLRSYERAGRSLRSATTWGILLKVPTVRILQPACLPAAFAFILVIQQTRGSHLATQCKCKQAWDMGNHNSRFFRVKDGLPPPPGSDILDP